MSQFPSPAQDYELNDLSLDSYLKPNPPATCLRRLHKNDDSMIGVGIMPNCILVIDNSLNAKDGEPVYAVVDSEKLVKTFYNLGDHVELHSENPTKNYPPIQLWEGGDWHIIGVVTFSVFKFK